MRTCLPTREHQGQSLRLFRPLNIVEPWQWDLKDVAIQKQDRVECLVLSRRGLVITIAYRGTHDRHQFSIAWGEHSEAQIEADGKERTIVLSLD